MFLSSCPLHTCGFFIFLGPLFRRFGNTSVQKQLAYILPRDLFGCRSYVVRTYLRRLWFQKHSYISYLYVSVRTCLCAVSFGELILGLGVICGGSGNSGWLIYRTHVNCYTGHRWRPQNCFRLGYFVFLSVFHLFTGPSCGR